MKGKNANQIDLKLLADEIKNRPLLTRYLTPAKKSGYICICGNGSGDKGTGAEIGKDGNRLLCGKCGKGYSNIDIIAKHLGIGTTGKDFIEVVKFGCQEFGLTFTDEIPTEKVEKFDRLEEAQNNLANFVKNQGGKWRGLSLETLQRIKAGFLPNVYFPAAGKELPAVVIPNDLGGVYFRALEGKFHKNNKPMATTTVFLPDSDSFDLFVTEGQINAASILQAVPNPTFGIMACSGTSGENNILAKLKQLTAQGKKFRVIIAFDFDSNGAGQKAAVDALKRLIDASFTAYTINITKTPDFDLNDVLRANNGEHYLYTLVNSAIDSAQIEFARIAAEESRMNLGNSRKDYFSNQFKPNIEENLKFKDRKTGFDNLDEELKFFLPGVYVISGLPALGKTSFALQLLNQMAESGETSIFVSYEMSEQFLYCKLLAREVYKIESEKMGEVKFPLTATDIMMQNINDFHEDAFNKAFEILTGNDAPFYIWEEKEIDVPKLLERIKKVCKQLPKPPIVCIDYLQLLGAGSDNPKSAIDDALRHFFNFRRETNTTFILISSLNRANYNTDANIASLKESGGIEYSADGIFFLQYLLESRTHADADEAMKKIPREIQLKCLKYRFGSRFDVGFFYYPNADFFKPMDIETYSDWNQNQETSNKLDVKKKISDIN